MTIKLAVLITCFNRKEKTLNCLYHLSKQVNLNKIDLKVYVVDDNSMDDTYLAIENLYPEIILIKGNGKLFWNGGMRLAQQKAMNSNPDYFLWLNDDTTLNHDAIMTLLECATSYSHRNSQPAIIIGSFSDFSGTKTTYGGLIRSSNWQQTRFNLVPPSTQIQQCCTMNGNCVLVPAAIANSLGKLEKLFSHGMGDVDYGLRAKQLGYDILIAPNFIGQCERNSLIDTFDDLSLPLKKRIRHILSPKGLPIKTWFIFTRRHAGVFWPLFFIWPYCRIILSALISKCKK